MLNDLAPARRRLVLGAAATVLLTLVVIAVIVALGRPEAVDPVSQDAQGPVLLVPGYGGSTVALEVLAGALRGAGREVLVVHTGGSGTGDLLDQARVLDEVARAALSDSGARSVDVVGYSAGGVVARLWARELDGDAMARRVVTLASPHHGTSLAGLAVDLAPDACPTACQQLAPDSDLLRDLNADDETPEGPRWVTLWTTDDQTVVPPESGALQGSLAFSVQEVCPSLSVAHADMPRTPAVVAMVRVLLDRRLPVLPSPEVCEAA